MTWEMNVRWWNSNIDESGWCEVWGDLLLITDDNVDSWFLRDVLDVCKYLWYCCQRRKIKVNEK